MDIIDKTVEVRLRLTPKTLNLLDNISELTEISNKTTIIASSIQLTEELVRGIKEGGKLYVEYPNGYKNNIYLKQ